MVRWWCGGDVADEMVPCLSGRTQRFFLYSPKDGDDDEEEFIESDGVCNVCNMYTIV